MTVHAHQLSQGQRDHLHGFTAGDASQYGAIVRVEYAGESIGSAARASGINKATLIRLLRRYRNARQRWEATLPV